MTLAVWGLTFKARTDDLRDSPALAVIDRLRAAGAHIRAYDPSIPDGRVDDRQADLLEGIEIVADPYAACEGAAALLVLTEWDEFRWLDFDKVGETLAAKRVVDARNLLDREALRRRGFAYSRRRAGLSGPRRRHRRCRLPRLAPHRRAARPRRRGGLHRQPA